MTSEHSSRRHQEVLANVADTREISGITPNATRLGSFVVDQVGEGQYVPLGNRYAMKADFSHIEMLDGPLDAQYEEFKQELTTNPERQGLNEALEACPPEMQETFRAALFSTEMACGFFHGAFNSSTKERRDLFGWLDLDQTREDSYKIKKLSQTADEGVCVEYSLLAGEIMRRLGQEAQYTVGYRQDWADEEGTYHAFLTTDDTHVLIDAYSLAQTLESAKPLGLLTTSQQGGIMQRPDDIAAYKDIFGRDAYYSATPIKPNDERRLVAA